MCVIYITICIVYYNMMKNYHKIIEIIFFSVICLLLANFYFFYDKIVQLIVYITYIIGHGKENETLAVTGFLLSIFLYIVLIGIRAYIFPLIYKLDKIFPTIHRFFNTINTSIYLKTTLLISIFIFDYLVFKYFLVREYTPEFIVKMVLFNGLTFNYITMLIWMGPKSKFDKKMEKLANKF